jgi:hypothetical protein
MRVGVWFLAALAAALPIFARAATAAQAPLAVPVITSAPPLDPRAPVETWGLAAKVDIVWDVPHSRPASEASTARVAASGDDIYVRFDVKQHEPVLATQHANNVGDGTDDEVWIDLWPGGKHGFFYQFAATSNGTHFQYSSENTAYAPTWQSFGTVVDGGFVVTMKIPLQVLRGATPGAWLTQFVRVIRSSGEYDVWSYAQGQTNWDDVNYAGAAHGFRTIATKPQPRFGAYGLGALGSPNSGLSTARVGVDYSIPVTANTSLYGTIHPDFSNVEVDQSTISPTAFARYYNEVRPFFTQGANNYDNFNCNACPGITELYTPNIPTPNEGYAIEGRQGPAQFAAFDSVGTGRVDAAQAFAVNSSDNDWLASFQRVAVNEPGLKDDTVTSGLSFNDHKNISAYFNYGSDSGTNVLLGNQAQRYDGGIYYYTNTFGAAFSSRKVGYFYNPVDGLIQHPDIAGYGTFFAKIITFKDSWLNSVGISGFIDRYHNAAGVLDQSDNNVIFDILTANRIDIQTSIGSSYLLSNNCATSLGNLITVTPINYSQYASCQVMTPISQNGVQLTWHSGTQNSPGNFPNHGSESNPTIISFNTGIFGPGRLDSWVRSTTMRVGLRGALSLEADDTRQYLYDGGTNIQWLERAGYTYVLGPDASLAFGVRRIIGTAPTIVSNSPAMCQTYLENPEPSTPCTGAWNLSFAYHKRTPHDEYYFAYGDASQTSTVPQWILKWIKYIGAEKGT